MRTKLDPRDYSDDENAHALAVAVSEAVERERRRRLAREKPSPQGILNIVAKPSDATPWYSIATDLAVLGAIAGRFNVDLPALADGICAQLSPPNWEVFFWIARWAELELDKAKRNAARKEQAKAAARNRHAPTAHAKQLVLAWWREHGAGKMNKEQATDEIVKLRLVGEARTTIRRWLRKA